MKKLFNGISFMIGLSLILAACSLPGPGDVSSEDAAATAEAGSLVTVDLAGPSMAVGSKYPYVDGTILVAVPGGSFLMGHDQKDNPIHEVTLSDFWIYSTKVTNTQYAACVQAGICTPPDLENNPTFGSYRHINFPVTGVNHTQAGAYCAFVKGRLPSEAEWEKTARGPEGNIFPWGDEAPVCDLLNFDFCKSETSAVNDYDKGVSYYSAFDMAGNAREWVADWYSLTYYSESPAEDPLGPEFGEKRSVRGSSYQDGQDAVMPSNRFALDPEENLSDLGFRCVIEDPMHFAPMCEVLGYVGTGPNGEEADCTPTVMCNDVSISQNPLCTRNYFPYTIVTVNLGDTPPDGWTYDVPGCSAVPGEQTATKDKFSCLPGAVGPATAQGSCVELESCVSTCPMYYTKVGDACVWDGGGTSGTACLPGHTYDPLTQCCSAVPGAGVDFGLCPVGTYPFNGACIANPNAVVDSAVQDIEFLGCTPPPDGGGDDDGDDDTPGCQPPANGCPMSGEQWNPATCSCYCPAGPTACG
ncbi:MAG: SUMF1/EgtB/PvdO family nonheme iron enzyme [Anaerolineales bacterium]|nr:MAG: SUMF1/EgtB/PvdO family nonheme iron enzyme [Anaerolineales bacterium]